MNPIAIASRSNQRALDCRLVHRWIAPRPARMGEMKRGQCLGALQRQDIRVRTNQRLMETRHTGVLAYGRVNRRACAQL